MELSFHFVHYVLQYTRLTPVFRTIWVSWYQNVIPLWVLLQRETTKGLWCNYKTPCRSFVDRQTTTIIISTFSLYRPDAIPASPTNDVKMLKAKLCKSTKKKLGKFLTRACTMTLQKQLMKHTGGTVSEDSISHQFNTWQTRCEVKITRLLAVYMLQCYFHNTKWLEGSIGEENINIQEAQTPCNAPASLSLKQVLRSSTKSHLRWPM